MNADEKTIRMREWQARHDLYRQKHGRRCTHPEVPLQEWDLAVPARADDILFAKQALAEAHRITGENFSRFILGCEPHKGVDPPQDNSDRHLVSRTRIALRQWRDQNV